MNPFARIRSSIKNLRDELHEDIANVDAKVEGVLNESRSDMNRIQERVNGLEGSLRDRMGWIEGFLRKSTESPANYDYNLRELERTEPKE